MSNAASKDGTRSLKSKRPARTKNPKSEGDDKVVDNIFKMHLLKGAPESVAKLEWDNHSRSFEAEVMTMSEAVAYVRRVKPSTVTPVKNDKTKVMRCDWSILDNQYICDLIDADDPRATL